MNKKIRYVHFNCPVKLLEDFDKEWQRRGTFQTRTEAILHLMRSFVENREGAKEESVQ